MKNISNAYNAGSLALREVEYHEPCKIISYQECIEPEPWFRGKHARQPIFDWMIHSLQSESISGVAFNRASKSSAVLA